MRNAEANISGRLSPSGWVRQFWECPQSMADTASAGWWVTEANKGRGMWVLCGQFEGFTVGPCIAH